MKAHSFSKSDSAFIHSITSNHPKQVVHTTPPLKLHRIHTSHLGQSVSPPVWDERAQNSNHNRFFPLHIISTFFTLNDLFFSFKHSIMLKRVSSVSHCTCNRPMITLFLWRKSGILNLTSPNPSKLNHHKRQSHMAFLSVFFPHRVRDSHPHHLDKLQQVGPKGHFLCDLDPVN